MFFRKISRTILIISFIILCSLFAQAKAEEQKRAITFLDIIQMRSLGGRRNGDISPDGKWFVYTIRVPDRKANRRFADIYVTPLTGGKTKQMTFTKDKNEKLSKWNKDSSLFAFLSNRSEDKNQIFFMRPDGGEAWQVTNDKFGVSSYEFSSNGKYLVYLGGRPDEKQIWIMPSEGGKAEKLTDLKTPISSYLWNPNGKKIYFVASAHLWQVDIETKEEIRLTAENEYTVADFIISDDGTKIAFIGSSKNSEVYLLDLNTNAISRLTNNSVGEWSLGFSPDSKWFSFVCGGGEGFSDPGGKVYIMPTKGGELKKLMSNFAYSDPANPVEYYYSEPMNFNNRDKWVRLTDANPQVKGFLLGKYETIRWKSTDGRTIEGLLIKPDNYREDRKYPLIVDIHGGPSSAYTNGFSSDIHIFSANDYVVFQPNYRGSSGYGEEFKRELVGGWPGLSFDDIMTGVDYLIERGIVQPDSMGIRGWSAGGDLSNWALVSTHRFKAISTGASSLFPEEYIRNAKTPTLIHCGENDKNNISQSEELYTALRQIGVPTEFIVYPNTGHTVGNVRYGIGNMRYMMVKMQADFYWFEKWIRGKTGLSDWTKMIETLERDKKN